MKCKGWLPKSGENFKFKIYIYQRIKERHRCKNCKRIHICMYIYKEWHSAEMVRRGKATRANVFVFLPGSSVDHFAGREGNVQVRLVGVGIWGLNGHRFVPVEIIYVCNRCCME